MDVVWSTGAPVLRQPFFDDPYYEELSMDPASIRLGRLNNGAPFLSVHDQSSLQSVIGSCQKAWLDNGEGCATVKMSDREDVAPIISDIENGILRNISIGYRIFKMQDATPPGATIKTMIATDWEPFEISLVPVGADAAAGVRNQDALNSIEIETQSEVNKEISAERANIGGEMDPKELEAARQATLVADQNEIEKGKREAADKALTAERARVSEIASLVRTHKVDAETETRFISDGTSLDEVRKQVLNSLVEKQPHITTTVSTLRDSSHEQNRKLAIENAILYRADSKHNKLTDGGREFANRSLLEMVRANLEGGGVNTSLLTKTELASRAFHTTSDFPNILANVANKSLRTAYEEAPKTYLPLVRETEVADFKTITRNQLGEAPDLELVTEDGEVKRGTIGEAKESYNVQSYAKIFAITRKALINDDLQAFTRLPQQFGTAAARLEADLVYGIFTANAAMDDDVALFHATHKNLPTSSATLDNTAIGAMIAKLKAQTGINGKKLGLMPKYLITGVERDGVAISLLTLLQGASSAANANIYASMIQHISDPRLDAAPFYLAGDVSQIDIIEVAYLQGQRGVYIEPKMGFDVEGMEIKARLDVGAKAIDWRGLVKNAGT